MYNGYNTYSGGSASIFDTLFKTNKDIVSIAVAVLLIVLFIRIIIARSIAKRGNMVLIAKGYDPEDIHLTRLAVWITLFFGFLLAYVIVFWHISSFPIVKATSDLNTEYDIEVDSGEERLVELYRGLSDEAKQTAIDTLERLKNKEE